MTHELVRFLRARMKRHSRYTPIMRISLLAVLVLGNVALAQELGYKRGQIYADFHLPKLSGGFGRLSDYRGKNVVLINFASW